MVRGSRRVLSRGAGRWRRFAAVTVGARALPGAAKGVAVLGARDRVSRGAAPPLTPARPSSCCRFCCCVFSFCFLSGGYALPLGVAPCFLIVYAPAMRAVAYYALSGVVVASAHGWCCRLRGYPAALSAYRRRGWLSSECYWTSGRRHCWVNVDVWYKRGTEVGAVACR